MPPAFIEKSSLEAPSSSDGSSVQPLVQFRGPRLKHFTERPFPRLFEEQASQVSEKVAVICEHDQLTLGELNARANQLARHLRALGVGRESLVGICVDRSPEMAVGILGILKSGGAYLPLDPEYPQERLAFMLEDARPALVLTKSKLEIRLPRRLHRQDHSPLPLGEGQEERASDAASPHPTPPPTGEGSEPCIVLLDQDWAAISENSDENLIDGPLPNDLAYVIYTSGSTGKPKGVMITHGNLANYLRALDHELDISPDDLYLHTASIAFSSSRRQLMLPLSQGATVVIATSEQRKDPLALFEMIKRLGVTVMDAVPSFWRNCTAVLASLESDSRKDLLDNKLRLMLSASEPLRDDIPRTWTSQFGHSARHVHMFGQTETAGIVSLYRLPTDMNVETKVVPIGRPIANCDIFILDEERRPCAVGVTGELYIGGAGVGRGYLNRAELTSEKFISHPFSHQPDARLYRTGDWAKCRADGQIEFVGRRDQQVKLRGFRVELGEVEAVLASHPAIRESIVTAREEGDAEKRLIAYFVVNQEKKPTGWELRRFLNERLPDYLVPSVFVQLDVIPLSANGKVNRLALPDPDNARPELSARHAAPRNATQQRLSEIWSAVLRLEGVGVNDNFFELGGNSLLATQVISRARNEFKVEMPLRLLFEHPTIALLAAVLDNAAADRSVSIGSCKPAPRNGTAPLSFTQQQFWLLDQGEPDSSYYNVRTAIKVAGSLDIARLQQAFDAIVARHEILRTSFVLHESSPLQVIPVSMPLVLDTSDLSSLSTSERETEVQRVLAVEAEKPFDLAHRPLLRVQLLKLGKLEHLLLLTVHHIIFDGWSIGVFLRELAAHYQAQSDQSTIPQLQIQFADFALWQRQRAQSDALKLQLEYWKNQLANAPAVLDLPTDFPRPTTQTFNGAQESLWLPSKLTKAIKALSQREGATLFMTLMAAFQTLLRRYSRQDDVVVGSPIAGRTLVETEDLIGAFVNTLVFRGDLSGNPTFREFLGRVRETALAAYANQEVPFEKLVEELRPERNTNRTPLFQVMFAVRNTPIPDLELAGLTLSPLKLSRTKSRFDLTLEVEEEATGLHASLEYNTDLFTPATMRRMLDHFQNLLEAVVADPGQRLSDLSVLSDSERRQLLVEWNDTSSEFSRDACIHELFEAQVERTPEAVAAEFQAEELTYRELNARANQLANYLRNQGVGSEVLVGVCIGRSLEMLVGILGVLKAGGAYVPLDPSYPRERIAFMIEDAGLALILTQERLAKDIPAGGARFVYIDADAEIIGREIKENPVVEVTPLNLAYVIYTSGSTGNPKGVMVEHRSLVSFTEAVAAEYGIHSGDRILQFASLCFDLSAEEIYPALSRGATVVLRTDAMISSPRDFLRQCAEQEVTVLDLPTTYWHELTDALDREGAALPASVRLVIIGGEKALPDRVATWKRLGGESVRLVNSYGPTETTVVATVCDLAQLDENACRNNVPIGRPIRNTTVYVLDESLRPVPIGVSGELYIGGAGVARGYVNQIELTRQKFFSNPFGENGDARLYKTGDVVRYRHDGNLEFLGRVDNQIKIRGFRVELEEIERALTSHPHVADSVVVLHEDISGDKRLVSYLVLSGGSQPTSRELRNFLKAKLPSYMIPAAFETIDALPLMPNGKVDRCALPEPLPTQPGSDQSFVPPSLPIEELLAQAWRDALRLERVGIHDNFFELGGHSLLAARVVSNVRRVLDIELGMVDVLRSPTIAELAALLYEREPRNENESELCSLLQELLELSDEEAQRRVAQELGQSEGASMHYLEA